MSVFSKHVAIQFLLAAWQATFLYKHPDSILILCCVIFNVGLALNSIRIQLKMNRLRRLISPDIFTA